MDYYFTANNYGDHYLQEVNGSSFNKLGAHAYLSDSFDSILLKKERLYIIVGSDSSQIPQYLLKKGIPAESEYLFIETDELYSPIKEVFPKHPQLHLCRERDWKQKSEELGFPLHIQCQSATLVRSSGASHNYHKEYPPLFEAINQHYQSASAEVSANSNPFHFYKVGFTNLAENRYNISTLEDQFKGKTAILVGAAPSLDQHTEWIQQNQKHLYIFTVSRLAEKLHNLGIIPDFIVTVDPLIDSFYLGKEAIKFEEKSILIHSYHANPQFVSQWGGEQLFTGFRYPWKTAQNDDGSEQTGSTVSNAALDSAITMGFSQILLAGIDFCFNNKGYTHASNTGPAATQAPMVIEDPSETTVINNLGENVETLLAFKLAGKEFSKAVSNNKKPYQTISNLSGSALKMEGVKHTPKEQVILDTTTDISRPEIPETSQQNYFKNCLKELKSTNTKLSKINSICKSIIQENKKLFNKNGGKNNKIERKIIKLENSIKKNHASLLHLLKRIGQREILKYLHATRSDQKLWTHNEITTSSTAYYNILRKMIKMVQNSIMDSTQRIGLRQQELLSEPNSIESLITQWKEDKQPRRALFWKQSHTDAHQRLTSKEQQKLTNIIKEFTHFLKSNQTQDILHNSIAESLQNIINLANNRNKRRIEQLIQKFDEHPDQENAPYYIVLCEALIAEFDERDQDAFTSYATLLGHQEKLTKEMIFLILERVSTTSIRLKDYNNAIFSLQTLSETYESDYHTPIYAELLYLTGNPNPAVEVFQKYIEKNPRDIKTIFRLADLQLKDSQHDTAQELYRHILSQDSSYLPAQQRLEEINQTKMNT